MSSKLERHRSILAVVTERIIGTQAELRRALARRGHTVDQATLSRDIRELGLVKLAAGQNGGNSGTKGQKYRYAPSEQLSAAAPDRVGGLIRSVRTSRNLVVIRTGPGNANPVALAIDRLDWSEILGTVAGDDTLFLVVDEKHSAKKVKEKVEGLDA